ncbi:mutants block sporulation after engulfment [Salipaludibacillus neizhouensis]|uniref:Mutants block sporulation after engulfment n=1 Tax=Salipaludibacillus neizhouensis TaxID=885475 RepID=A0A3A9KAY8_9BACI|nr:SpoIIIAH-like family protein [Salipaludibacillus neizhouensis]RKL68768.1 mutants block sporulation after engulfment [Salipaludibacillus neizhouensis]
MILKRQTVWLLTMLSLIIVLSVYYISMDRIENQQASIEEVEEVNSIEDMDLDKLTDELEIEWLEGDEETFIELEEAEDVIGNVSGDMSAAEMFDTIKLQRQDARSKLNEEYVSVIAAAETNPEIQVEAMEKVESLQKMSQQEEMVETIIRSQGYEDVLVMSDENQVNIYVRANELSKEEVVEINQLAYEHLGIETVRVGFQPGN